MRAWDQFYATCYTALPPEPLLQAVVAATRACVEREYGERAPAAAELRDALERVLALRVPL